MATRKREGTAEASGGAGGGHSKESMQRQLEALRHQMQLASGGTQVTWTRIEDASGRCERLATDLAGVLSGGAALQGEALAELRAAHARLDEAGRALKRALDHRDHAG